MLNTQIHAQKSYRKSTTLPLTAAVAIVALAFAMLTGLSPVAHATTSSSPGRVMRCPNWKDEVRLYGIAPHYAAPEKGQSFKTITAHLPRIAREGYNMVWLQPIQANHGGGQGYEVTDYFKIWDQLGTEDDLKTLVSEAHRLGLRVILDFVANHTSIEHPFAQDVVRKGQESAYYDWYMHEADTAPYAQHYNRLTKGDATFLYYFWDHLVNLNFSNSKVREHLTKAAEPP